MALADHLAMMKKTAALADTAKPKLQDDFSRLCPEFKSCRSKSKKKLDDITKKKLDDMTKKKLKDMTSSYNGS